MMSKYPLLGMTLIELQSLVKRLGMPGFAAKQIASWLYDKKVTSIDEMTNLSLWARIILWSRCIFRMMNGRLYAFLRR